MIFLGPASNGEYDPVALDDVTREAQRRIVDEGERLARRVGMDRRRFLASACGTALSLLVLDACSKDSGGGRAGGFATTLPPESTTEPDAAHEALGGDELVLDLQTHLLEGDARFGASFPQSTCAEGDCFSIDHYLEALFVRSDTDVAVLSAIPAATPFRGPLSIDVMEQARRVAEAAECGGDRLLIQGQAVPTMAGFEDAMRRVAAEHRIAAWKAYTHVPVPWRLDSAVGDRFLRLAVELGHPIVSVHKGFGADPVDVGPAAAAHPDVKFVIYHSGYEPGRPEAIDRLLRSLRDAGVGRNENVYAELGSTWWNVMRTPDAAAHVLGSLLRDVGEDRVVWGTDSIWYGSPQQQLEAFRAFTVSDEAQERFGYPALTPVVKAKVLGRNAAALYGLSPDAVTSPPRCTTTRAELRRLRDELPPSSAMGPRTAAAAAAVRARDWAWSPA